MRFQGDMAASRAWMIGLWVLGAAGSARAAAVGPFWAVLDADVPAKPAGKHAPACTTQELGTIAAIAGVDGLTMVTVVGFKRAWAGDICAKELHFLHVVVGDPAPPRWRDAGGFKELKPSEWYVDPLHGGSVPVGKDQGDVADDKPFFDGETRDTLAADTGEFGGPDQNLSKAHGWSKDTKLDLVLGVRPDKLRPGLEYLTLLVGVDGHELYPIAVVPWGMKAEGAAHLDWPVQGARMAKLFSNDQLEAALKRSGFDGWTVRDALCRCNAAAPRKAKASKKPSAKH